MANMVQFRPNRKVLMPLLAVVVIIAAAWAGVGLRMLQDNGKKQNGTNKDADSSVTTANLGAPLPGAAETAQNLRTSGDTGGATKAIDDAIASPSTPTEERYNLYIQRGNLLMDTGNKQGALTAYLEAEKLQSTFEIVYLLAFTYEDAGNKPKAIEYFKKALPLVKGPMAEADKIRIEGKIQSLGGTL
jgi:tetratricopeptide (TPR) repeat protein